MLGEPIPAQQLAERCNRKRKNEKTQRPFTKKVLTFLDGVGAKKTRATNDITGQCANRKHGGDARTDD